MKGDEIYRLIEKRNTYKTYALSPRKTQRVPNIKAIAASSLPILVTVLYFTFTSLFFASEGPISLAKQFALLVPKSWGDPRLHSGFQYFLLNFITYGAVLSGLAVGIPTTCRAIYKELYEYFSESNDLGAATPFLVNDVEGRQGTGIAESSARKARFCCPNITRGMLIFYVATFFDSTGFGFNAFYNSMQAMLAPSQLPITNKLGGCHFLLILALTVAVGITATSMAWTKYNGDEKYESFTGLWKKSGISHDDLVEHEPFILMEDCSTKEEEGGVSRQGSPVQFWGSQPGADILRMPSSGHKKGRGTPSPQQNKGRETPRSTNF